MEIKWIMDQMHFVKSCKFLKSSGIKIIQKKVTLTMKSSIVGIYFPTNICNNKMKIFHQHLSVSTVPQY